MKNKFKFTLALILLFLIGESCNKYLTTSPQDTLVTTQYYQTNAQIKEALSGIYSYLAQDGTFSRNLLLELEMSNDEGQFDNRNNVNNNPSLYDCQASTAIYSACWTDLYAGINAANLLLANIDSSAADANVRQVAKGEALFLRGFFYFQLVIRYGDVPLVTKPNVNVSNFNNPRTPSIQVYNQILADMKAAQPLVRNITDLGTPSHINKTAIAGIIARVYLKMAGHPLNLGLPMYDSARGWAESVIYSGIHSLCPSYSQIFIHESEDIYDINETMFEVEFYGNNTPPGSMPPGSRFACQLALRYPEIDSTNPNVAYGFGAYIPTGYLYDSIYLKYPSDTLRRNWVIPNFAYGNTIPRTIVAAASSPWDRGCGKWRRDYETVIPKNADWSPTDFPVIRYADVLLMAAEAENELGNTNTALQYLNQVRERALAEDVPSTDQNSLRQIIHDERARELCFEGLRKFDLIRWGVFNQQIANCISSINNSTSGEKARYLRAYNNVTYRDTLLPIPSSEISVNTSMTQNPGW